MSRPRNPSLRTRLLVPLLVILLVGLAGAPVLASIVMRRHLDQRAEQRMHDAARTVGGLLSGRAHVRLSEAQLAQVPRSATLLLIGVDADGHAVLPSTQGGAGGRTADTQAAGLADAALAHPVGAVTGIRLDGIPYDVTRTRTPGLWFAGARSGGAASPTDVKVSQVVIATSRVEDEADVHTLKRAGGGFAIGAMVVLGSLAVWTIRRALRPLEQMAATADAAVADPQHADFRAATEGAPPEIARLGTALAEAFTARQRAEETVRAFMLDASHELRTPLTSISGWLDLYAQGGLSTPAELDRAVARMESEVGRMRLLVEDLDLLARVDQGRPLELDMLLVEPLLAAVLEDVRVLAPDRSVTLDVEGHPVVRADARRLEQVVRNLVGNALQHTPDASPVEIRVRCADPWVGIEVIDHGPGIAEEDLPHVFDRFYRATAARRRPGSGLGLAIVRALVEAHGGTVRASGTDGGGTTMTVHLPAVAPVSEPSGSG